MRRKKLFELPKNMKFTEELLYNETSGNCQISSETKQ